MSVKSILLPALLIAVVVGAGGWYLWQRPQPASREELQYSGTVEAVEVLVGPEIAGRVAEVFVKKGDHVKVGERLFRMDSEILDSQRKRAQTGVDSASAGLETARTGLELAQASLKQAEAAAAQAQVGVEAADLQFEMAVNTARTADLPARNDSWNQKIPDEFAQPAWYFGKEEAIAAAHKEVDEALKVLQIEQDDYQKLLQNISAADLKAAEERLAQAQASFSVAQDVLDRARDQREEALKDSAQSAYDSATSELEAAQNEYDRLLTEQESADILEARANIAAAQASYDAARDRLAALLTDEDALQVQAALLGKKQAQSALTQAQAGVDQARASINQARARVNQAQAALSQANAELDLIDVQLRKLLITAAVAGVVTNRNIEPGELAQTGAAALNLGDLDHPTITVYVPEDQYGQIRLGMPATVTVDSFPGETFQANVERIADAAEFTPRNVQTSEGRRTTVFAVELAITNPDGKLKPGMPADVNFGY